MGFKDKGFMKGFLAGILICTMAGGVGLMSGCLDGSSGTSAVPETSDTDEVQKTGDSQDETDSDTKTVDVDISKDYSKIEEKLDTIQTLLDQYYIGNTFGESVTTEDLEEGIYKGYVDALDEPYTVYYTADEYSDLMQSSSGTYSGIGVVVTENTSTGAVTVVRPFQGSPGANAGMLKNDIIYSVDGKEATGVDLSEVVSWIKGEEGTTVEIEIYRPSDGKYYTLKMKRRTIEIPMVEYQMLDNSIGYVAISEFEETTADQFDTAVDDLTSQGMKGLIIDLRDNPGGLLTSATEILDRILPKDKLLVYTVDKNDQKEELYSEDDDTIDVPITLLVNENSASASEIVSGCLKDYGVATLVGTKTFGKGIVQYVIPLDDGSAVKITCSKYYTPNGVCIHGTGIEPDEEVELETEETTASTITETEETADSSVADADQAETLESSESSDSDDSGNAAGVGTSDVDPAEDNQLEKAVEVLESELAE